MTGDEMRTLVLEELRTLAGGRRSGQDLELLSERIVEQLRPPNGRD
jgi:hypothetical protein